jgi:hypothetical protein
MFHLTKLLYLVEKTEQLLNTLVAQRGNEEILTYTQSRALTCIVYANISISVSCVRSSPQPFIHTLCLHALEMRLMTFFMASRFQYSPA